MRLSVACLLLLVAFWRPASAGMICTAVAELATGKIVHSEGDCETRVTPASTFKIALAAIGYESGFLEGAHAPVLSIRSGEPDWGGAEWRRPVDPAGWMKHSVVWYSQRITSVLGRERFAAAVHGLDYGNGDVSGDPGKDNGLLRSWIGSSLKISPVEQIGFLGRLLSGRLPVRRDAAENAIAIIESSMLAGWRVAGKTGSAYPRAASGQLDRSRGWGWFVGWAVKDGRTYVFARLDQDTSRQKEPGGLRARKKFLDAWPALSAGFAR